MRQDSLVQLPAALTAPATTSHARFVMGIDGGATKTLAAVLDLDGRIVSVAEGGPSNEDAVGTKAAVDALLAVADQALERAGTDRRELATAVLAVAGTDTEAIARQVRAARSDDWIVVNDVVGAWAAATGGEPGVGAISGTGSNVFGVGRRRSRVARRRLGPSAGRRGQRLLAWRRIDPRRARRSRRLRAADRADRRRRRVLRRGERRGARAARLRKAAHQG